MQQVQDMCWSVLCAVMHAVEGSMWGVLPGLLHAVDTASVLGYAVWHLQGSACTACLVDKGCVWGVLSGPLLHAVDAASVLRCVVWPPACSRRRVCAGVCCVPSCMHQTQEPSWGVLSGLLHAVDGSLLGVLSSALHAVGT
jgi:hypothetical protein